MIDLYKIIIVDDEFFIRDGLASYDFDRLGFKIVGTASNGEEALDIMKQVNADLVITDVKMPIMDGLELSKIIEKSYPFCKVVILTGYKDFDYIRESIQNGVVDYLLKPVDFIELDQLISKIKLKLDNEKENLNLVDTYKKKLEKSIPVAVDTFLKDIITGNLIDFHEIQEKMNLFEISFKNTFYNCTIVQMVHKEKITSENIINSFLNKLKNYIEEQNLGYIYFDSDKYEVVLLLNYNICSDVNLLLPILEDVKRFISNCLDEVDEGFNYDMFYGVGNVYKSIFNLPLSYKEATEALNKKFFYSHEDTFFYEMEAPNFTKEASLYPYEKETVLLDSIFDGDIDDSKTSLNRIFQDFDTLFVPLDSIKYKRMIIQLITSIERKLALNNISLEENIPEFYSYMDMVESSPNLSDLKEKVESFIIKISEYINRKNSEQGTSCTNAINKALKYVNENFQNKITLADVSESVFFTPNYFSSQFKKETGKSFVEYIKMLRIQKSKELLNETNLKVYEISKLVGYENPKYFTDVFKDYTGMSPLEFRQKTIKNIK